MIDILFFIIADTALVGLYFVSERPGIDEKTGQEQWIVASDDWSSDDFEADADHPERFRKRFASQKRALDFAERRIRAIEKLKRGQREPLRLGNDFVIADPDSEENDWRGETREDALRLAALPLSWLQRQRGQVSVGPSIAAALPRVPVASGGHVLALDDAGLPKDGTTVLDFNKAYNPPCAFTEFATCPLPPAQNALPIAVRAGEKKYGSH